MKETHGPENEKAALSQGGFLWERGCDVQRHEFIMHDCRDTVALVCTKTTRWKIRPLF
jgi:hypothetical protein